MPSTPTTEGSIVGYLRLDISDWNAKLDAAEAKARELGRTDPNIKVSADTAEALAKIEAVQAAADRLGGTTSTTSSSVTPSVPGASVSPGSASKVDDVAKAEARLAAAVQASEFAASRAYLAELRLEDVQSKGKQTALQLAVAEEAAATAVRKAEIAEAKATAAADALAAAQKKAAEDAAALAVAQEANAAATNKAAAGNKANGGYMAMVAGLVAALLPMMGPLTGYVVGVGSAFLGMGAAGVLAILGIKNAMAEGTAAGNTFSGGLHILKGDLDQLSNTAATAMLTHFQEAVSTIDGYMPSLNREIGLFSGMLGTTGNIVLTTLVQGFKILNPLFVQAGVYVEQLAVGFQKWTTNGGLAKFAHDAVTELPQVNQAIGSLLNGVVSLIGALAPMGTVMLAIVTVVGQLASGLTGLLGPSFAPIVAGAVAAYGAFQLWGTVGPLIARAASAIYGVTDSIVALGIATDVTAGPVGWMMAGIGAIAAIALVSASAMNTATQAQENYTAAVQQDNGVIGKNVIAQAAKTLQSEGALAAANRLGISTALVTSAVDGNTKAQIKVTAAMGDAGNKAGLYGGALNGLTAKQKQTQSDIDLLTNSFSKNASGIKDAIKAYNDIASASGIVTYTTKAQQAALGTLASSYGDSVPAYLAATVANKATADQLAATTQQMVLQDDASGLLTNALTILNGGSLSVAQAQTGLSAANNTLTASFKTNGAIVDGSTTKAVANQQAIQSQVTAAQQAAEAIGKQTGSTKDAIASYEASKQAIEDQLKAQGDLTPAVQTYIDKLYDIANLKVPVTKIDVDTAAATAKLVALQKLMAEVTASATTGPMASKLANLDKAAGHANGGTIQAFAQGGISGTVFGPGTSTSDSILTRLSVGEEVTRAARASTFRPMLKAINNGSPAQIQAQAARIAAPVLPSPAGPQFHFGDIIQQAGTSIAETMQSAGWFARAFTR